MGTNLCMDSHHFCGHGDRRCDPGARIPWVCFGCNYARLKCAGDCRTAESTAWTLSSISHPLCKFLVSL